VCSVLFADLVGFTTLSESRDPEDVRELLSRYFDTARTVIGRYGGVVEKFIGDAVMAVWGTPVATEGDTERAVRAALDLIDAVGVLGTELGAPDLAARAGVVTGEVAVSLGARGEGMVAGDAVNTAARVQAAAAPGTVLVDATSRRLSDRAIDFEDAGSHELKGKAAPEQLWRALRVLSAVGGSQRADGLEAPLTGRDAELRTLKELFHSSAERRTPRLVVVSGPAGVGKSRLGWEFEKYIDGVAETVFWHRGRCLSYGEGVAFWALAEIVRQRLGIAEEDTAEVAAAKLGDGLIRFVPDPGERAYVSLRLARLLGIPMAGDAVLAREELFAGWRMFFERLASTQPVVILVEDAHHADPALLDFFDHLVDWARDLPIFVLVFARPEIEGIKAGFGVGRNRAMLTLDPLDTASMDALVDALVPGMVEGDRASITTHAQGIPLFAVETVRSLIDRDIVVPHDGVYRLVGDIGALSVPDSIHGLLAARLDALDPPIRSLLADASVIGSSFPLESLVAVSGRPDDEVRSGLAELLRRDVLEISADPLSPQRGTYRFTQEMLRQVAYETISRHDRKSRHLAVAAQLRTVFANDGEEVMDVVARHYLDAIDAAPEDTDIEHLRDEARTALVRAAERANQAGATGRAATSFARAAELADDSLQAAGLWERASDASSDNADWENAVAYADSAHRLYAECGQDRAAARAQVLAGASIGRMGRFAEARAHLSAALVELQVDPDTDTVEALRNLAGLESFGGNSDATSLAAEALQLGEALDVGAVVLSRLFTTSGVVFGMANRSAEAAAYFREGARLAERADNPAELGRALLNLSDVLSSSDPHGAAETARAAMVHSRRVGQRAFLATAIANLSVALFNMGDWDQADTVLAEAIDHDNLGDQWLVQAFRAVLFGLRGDGEGAAAILGSLTAMRDSDDAQDKASAALVEAVVAAALDRPADVLAPSRVVFGLVDALGIRSDSVRWAWPLAYRAARTLGDADAVAEFVAILDGHALGHLPPLLRAERDLARAAAAADAGAPDAGTLMSDAITALRLVANPYHLADGLLDQAAYLSQAGDAVGAAAAVDEANSIGTTLRCRPLLQRAAELATPSVAVS
jgi:class 3 adenylate cyclase/tetratricopeptide (TPR) repeat protein